jgi:MFS family permease
MTARGDSLKHGWRVLAVSFSGMAILHGVRASFGILLPFMVDAIPMSLTVGSWLFWINWLLYAVASIAVGALIDRSGPRASIVVAGALLVGAGLTITAVSRAVWQAIIGFGVLAGIGSALIGNVVANVAAAKRFPARLGTALGVVNMGVGVGSAVFPLIVGLALSMADWRITWVVVAAVCSALLLGLLTRPRDYARSAPISSKPANPPSRVMRRLLTSRVYWGLFAAFLLGLLAQYGAIVHLPNAALSEGVAVSTTSLGIALAGLAGILGRLAFGAAADHLRDPALVALPGTLLYAAGIGFAATMTGTPGFLAAATLIGVGVSAYGPMWGNIIAARFPGDVLGRAYGTLLLGAGIGGSAGPVLVSRMVESGRSYGVAFMVLAGLALASLPLFFVKQAPGRSI